MGMSDFKVGDLFYGRLPIQIRLATPEEIKANRRLIPSNSMELETAEMIDYSTACEVIEG